MEDLQDKSMFGGVFSCLEFVLLDTVRDINKAAFCCELPPQNPLSDHMLSCPPSIPFPVSQWQMKV